MHIATTPHLTGHVRSQRWGAVGARSGHSEKLCHNGGVTPHPDNPAGRLFSVLSALKEVTNAQQVQIEVALAHVFELKDAPVSSVVLHRYVTQMVAWPHQAAEQLQTLDYVNYELLMRWWPKVDEAMKWAGRWGQPLNNLLNQYDNTTLYQLEVVADHLHSRMPEPAPVESHLGELAGLVQQAIKSVIEDGGFPLRVQQMLLERLYALAQAIDTVRIMGYPNVEAEVALLLGFVLNHPDAQTDLGHSLLKKIWDAFKSTYVAVGALALTTDETTKAIEGVQRLLH